MLKRVRMKIAYEAYRNMMSARELITRAIIKTCKTIYPK